MSDITTTDAWNNLKKLHAEKSETTLRDHFVADSNRAEHFTFEAAGLRADLSKNLVDADVVKQLVALAEEASLRERIDEMFAGTHLNNTEDRAVLHTALRMPVDAELEVDGQDVAADVHEVLGRMRDFASALRSGEWQGHTGHTIKKVVNIGIGGSDLGPAMATKALPHLNYLAQQAGMRTEYTTLPGAHSYQVWRAALRDNFEFAAKRGGLE